MYCFHLQNDVIQIHDICSKKRNYITTLLWQILTDAIWWFKQKPSIHSWFIISQRYRAQFELFYPISQFCSSYYVKGIFFFSKIYKNYCSPWQSIGVCWSSRIPLDPAVSSHSFLPSTATVAVETSFFPLSYHSTIAW